MTVLRHALLIAAAVLAMAGAPLHAQPSKGPPNALQGFSQNRDQPVAAGPLTVDLHSGSNVVNLDIRTQ